MKTKKVDVVAGYSYPNDKNALWFDLNTNTMRYWDGEKWESSQSQGSSLPTPTAEDVGKVLKVVDKIIETTERVTIVPRLTVLLVDNSTEVEELTTYTSNIRNVNDTAYDICDEYPGADTVKVIIDGVYCNYTTDNHKTYCKLSTESGFDITFYNKMLGIPNITSYSLSGPHTIEIYADIPTTHHEYVWEMVDEDIPKLAPGDVIDPGDGDK